MAKNPKADIAVPEPNVPERNGLQERSKVRVLAVEKAKNLIRKASAEHDDLFRRLAK